MKSPYLNTESLNPMKELARLWAYRIMLRLGGLGGLNSVSLMCSDEMLDLLAFDECPYDPDDEKDKCLVFLQERAERQEAMRPGIGSPLRENIAAFSRLVGLSRVEADILLFVIVMHGYKGMEEVTDTLGSLVSPAIVRAIAVIIGHPEDAVTEALSPRGTLVRAGILRFKRKDGGLLVSRILPMSGLVDMMLDQPSDGLAMVDGYFCPGRPGGLTVADIPHLETDRLMLESYLQIVLRRRQHGANILIYGPPGTGKTEFARLLAKGVGSDLYEISVRDSDGDPLRDDHRFSAYQLSQHILAKRTNAMILFDEIEDVFPGEDLIVRKAAINKGWVNELLETNPVPTIWISNDISPIDNAYLRRFDYILHIDVPPRPVRERILYRQLAGTPVSREWIRAVARHPDIAPAVIGRAVRVAQMMGGERQRGDELERRIERIVGNTLVAMGHDDLSVSADSRNDAYQTCYLNTSQDVDAIIEGARRRPDLRVCLYGPPGTGKTGFGHYLSESLGRPLLVKRASDVLGPYVGMTEKNIARMFQEARRQNAVLLLDEADSFLRDRRSARQSWEITQVNEMLTQMENHQGVFICSTNLVDNLDEASLRRFDFKVAFGYLAAEQAWQMFRDLLKALGGDLRRVGRRWQRAVVRLDRLTPGDFANAGRQLSLLGGEPDPERLLRMLEDEMAMKTGTVNRGVGFLADL